MFDYKKKKQPECFLTFLQKYINCIYSHISKTNPPRKLTTRGWCISPLSLIVYHPRSSIYFSYRSTRNHLYRVGRNYLPLTFLICKRQSSGWIIRGHSLPQFFLPRFSCIVSPLVSLQEFITMCKMSLFAPPLTSAPQAASLRGQRL